MAEIDLQFPLRGIDETRSSTRQQEGTTYDSQNVRSFEPSTGRARGSQRPGLRRLFYEQAVTKNDINGNPDGQTYPIQLLTHLVTTELVPPSEYGRFPYSQGSGNGFGIAAGNTGASAYSGLVATTSSAMACSCWDSGSKLFVAQVNTATGAVKISCINSSGETVWTNTSLTCATGSLRYVAGMTVVGTNLFVALITVAGTTSVIARLSATTGAIAAGDATWRTTSTFSILFSTNSVNCLGAIGTSLVIASNGASTGFIFLVDSTSPPGASYIAFSLHATTTPTNSRVKVCTDGVASIYIIAAVSSAQGQVRKYNLGLQLVWSSSVAGAPNSICYDKREALLVAACTTAPSFRSINIANGALLSAGPDSTYFWNDIESDNQGNLVAARDGAATDNFVGLSSGLGTVWGPSALANATHTGFSVNKGGSGAPTVLGARSVRPLVVAGGEVRTFSEDGPVAILTGDKLSRVARSIQAVQHGQNLYFADGTAYYYYKSSTNQLLTWTATVGTIPFASPVTKAATLIEKWRDRIVIAGFDDHLFYMSKQSDAFNWDFSPATVTSATAVAGTMPSDFGPIRAIISYSDDTMIWLCDHGTWRLTGDPQAGGVFDVISGSIGGGAKQRLGARPVQPNLLHVEPGVHLQGHAWGAADAYVPGDRQAA